jgi:hypothetical protein
MTDNLADNLATPITYEGGCHCGAVRFRVTLEKQEALECNCSICTQKGFLHLIVTADKFTLLQGEDALTTYQFNTETAKHLFCKHCGIHSFYRPRSHPDGFSVNLRCLDGLDGHLLSQFQIIPFDGKNWEENVKKIQD